MLIKLKFAIVTHAYDETSRLVSGSLLEDTDQCMYIKCGSVVVVVYLVRGLGRYALESSSGRSAADRRSELPRISLSG